MAMMLCPECGVETMDQLVSCPICDKPFTKQEKSAEASKAFFFYGAFAFCGLALATFCNMIGFTRSAIGIGVIALASMVILFFKLIANR